MRKCAEKKMKRADGVMWKKIGELTANMVVGMHWARLVVFAQSREPPSVQEPAGIKMIENVQILFFFDFPHSNRLHQTLWKSMVDCTVPIRSRSREGRTTANNCSSLLVTCFWYLAVSG